MKKRAAKKFATPKIYDKTTKMIFAILIFIAYNKIKRIIVLLT